jgi:hypothetical protein
MTGILRNTSLFCIAIVVAFSCKKNTDNTSTLQPATVPLNQLFDNLRSTPQTFTVTAGRDTVVFGSQGTMLHFYPNSFKNASGAIITSGSIDLKLVEMYKPGDMIRNRATTMQGKNLLTSGGQIDLRATINGQKVYANKYGIGYFQNNASATPMMELFYGNVNNVDSVVNWEAKDTTLERDIAWLGDMNGRNYITTAYGRPWMGYVFDSASDLEYTNCDAFYYSDSPKVSVTAIMPDATFTPENTQVYLVLPTINCAMSTVQSTSSYNFGTARYNASEKAINMINEGQTNIVPSGMKYILIVIANKSGQYYYSKQSGDAIPHNGLKLKATMTPDSKDNVLAMLSAM